MNDNKRPPNYRQAIKRCKNCKFMFCKLEKSLRIPTCETSTLVGIPMCEYDKDNVFETHWDCVCDVYEPLQYYTESTNESKTDK